MEPKETPNKEEEQGQSKSIVANNPQSPIPNPH